jgi:hypothetical protein
MVFADSATELLVHAIKLARDLGNNQFLFPMSITDSIVLASDRQGNVRDQVRNLTDHV